MIRRVELGNKLEYSHFMRRYGLALVVLAMTLLADTKTVTKMTFLGPYSGGRTTTRTEYQQGDNYREESETFSGDSPARPEVSITIAGKVNYQIDPTAHQYVEYELPQITGIKPASPPANAIKTDPSGKTLDIYFEITDTGESKEFFGKTAKHLIWRERRVAEPGACGMSYTKEIDGWYFPEPEESKRKAFGILTGGPSRPGRGLCVDKIVVHGRRPGGMAVIVNDGSFKTEIVELSHEPLDKSLFEVPSGYVKVKNLPGPPPPPPPTLAQQIQWEWVRVVREVEAWFR